MRSSLIVLKEQVKNFYLIRRLSLYELKVKNQNNYLGTAWEIINPLIQILIYWFVFQSVRQRDEIEMLPGVDVPFILWLISAFVLWTFFYKATIEGSKSIYSRIKVLSRMNFPLSVIPNIVMFSNFYIHIVMLCIVILIFQISGFYLTVYFLQIFYFLAATFFLVFGISLITSTLSTMMRDVHMFLNATLRMVLYLSPILWQIDMLGEPISTLAKINPLYYLIEGYRASFFGTEWYFVNNWEYTLYFWVVALIIMSVGAMIHYKFRRHFIDFI